MGERLTKQDIEKIEEEIKYRKLEVRPKALIDLKSARAQGDLSENFEYYAAKKFNRENNSRISYLEKMIKNAEIIEFEEKDDEVGINKKVKLEFIEDNEIEEYKITTSIRGSSTENRISIDSPLGRALLNHKINEIIKVEIDKDHSYNVKILSIEKDNSDDNIRQF